MKVSNESPNATLSVVASLEHLGKLIQSRDCSTGSVWLSVVQLVYIVYSLYISLIPQNQPNFSSLLESWSGLLVSLCGMGFPHFPRLLFPGVRRSFGAKQQGTLH